MPGPQLPRDLLSAHLCMKNRLRYLMKKKNSEEDFYTITDDNLYYQWQAVEFFKKRNIPYCFTKNENHSFIAIANNNKYVINKECGYWCLILWNGKTEPVWVNTADIFMYDSYFIKRKANQVFFLGSNFTYVSQYLKSSPVAFISRPQYFAMSR